MFVKCPLCFRYFLLPLLSKKFKSVPFTPLPRRCMCSHPTDRGPEPGENGKQSGSGFTYKPVCFPTSLLWQPHQWVWVYASSSSLLSRAESLIPITLFFQERGSEAGSGPLCLWARLSVQWTSAGPRRGCRKPPVPPRCTEAGQGDGRSLLTSRGSAASVQGWLVTLGTSDSAPGQACSRPRRPPRSESHT